MKVEIEASELVKLIYDSWQLQALEAGGVDNWEWYSESLMASEKCSLEDAAEYVRKHYKYCEAKGVDIATAFTFEERKSALDANQQ